MRPTLGALARAPSSGFSALVKRSTLRLGGPPWPSRSLRTCHRQDDHGAHRPGDHDDAGPEPPPSPSAKHHYRNRPHGTTKRPAPRGVVTASAVLRTIPKTTRQPAMPSEYSDAPTTGPNPRIVARQDAKIAPPKTIRTAATTRLSVRSTLAGWPSVVARPSSPSTRTRHREQNQPRPGFSW